MFNKYWGKLREGKGSEDAVQKRTFNYFPWPQTKDLDLFM